MSVKLSYQYIRRGSDQWGYLIDCDDGAKFAVFYQLVGQGHVRELLVRGSEIIYDRELRIGFKEWSFTEFIQNGLKAL